MDPNSSAKGEKLQTVRKQKLREFLNGICSYDHCEFPPTLKVSMKFSTVFPRCEVNASLHHTGTPNPNSAPGT